MLFPDTIVVKYTEEEAEYLSLRPVVQQQFRGFELIDMILRVTGKDLSRIQRILHSGTVVFHSYRYWWQGFDADASALREILSNYPDPDFTRPFRPEDCREVILESGGSLASRSLRFHRDHASKRKFLRARSFWDCLMRIARDAAPAYREYSYAERADLYAAPVRADQTLRLALEARRYATRAINVQTLDSASFSQIVYACPRETGKLPEGARAKRAVRGSREP
jgi:hypothetical protein